MSLKSVNRLPTITINAMVKYWTKINVSRETK